MFITFEGIEGSGKTTQLKHTYDYLKNRGHQCVMTREPGGTPIGKKIRAILLDRESKMMDPTAELLLYMADRAQHLSEMIRPWLKKGAIVLCDRYADATLVYQGYARGISRELIIGMHQSVLASLTPDLTFLFDLPTEKGLSRAWKQINSGSRKMDETRFEEEKISFHEKIRAGYLDVAKANPERFRIINALNSETQVRSEIIQALSARI
jgi:dTMP kinase